MVTGRPAVETRRELAAQGAALGWHETEIAHDVPVVANVWIEDVEPAHGWSMRYGEPRRNGPAGIQRAAPAIG
jgi:hypothetical protein